MSQGDDAEPQGTTIEYMTVEDLLDRSRSAREELARLWDGLSEADITRRPGPQMDWSVKDMIAHISWWETAMTDLVPRALAGEPIEFSGTIKDANATAFAENRDLSLARVLGEFETSWAQVESLLRQLSDCQINNTKVCQIFGKPLRHFIAANTFVHYADHVEDLKRYIARLQSES